MAAVKAPWSWEQVQSLLGYQECGYVHPYTSENGADLIPTVDGWVEVEDGPVVQNWAHDFTLDWKWRQSSR
jgi:hypothetical protein